MPAFHPPVLLERPMFPHTIDSTILSTFRSCPQKAMRQYVQHWKPRAQSVHLVAGGAFASGVEAARMAYYSGIIEVCEDPSNPSSAKTQYSVVPNNAELSQAQGLRKLIEHYGDFQPPADSSKTLERMCGALEFYFDQYPLGNDGANPITLSSGRRGIEFSFAEPLDILHPVTGEPILYTGRADMLAERAGGVYCYDEKTTTSLGQSWAKSWEMRSQFTGYQWAARKQGIKAVGSIVRGVSILKTKYDTMEVSTYRTQYELDRWEYQVIQDVKRMIRMWEEGHWDYNLDGACTEYGGCSFTQICKANDPDSMLPAYFEQKVWDPLARRELSVAEFEASWNHQRVIPIVAAPVFNPDSSTMQDEFAGMMESLKG